MIHRPDLSWCPSCWGACDRPEGSRAIAALLFLALVLLGGLASWAGVL